MKIVINRCNSRSVLEIATLTWAGSLAGCAQPDGTEPPFAEIVPLASPTTSPAGQANLAGAGDQVYVSWIEAQPDGTHALRLATLTGDSLGTPRTIASGRDWFVNFADFPMIAVHPTGALAAHWLVRSGPGKYSYDALIATSIDGGLSWSSPIKPYRHAVPAEHGFVSLFALGDGFGVVWLDGRKHAAAQARNAESEGEMTVHFTTLARDGSPGAEVEIDGRACDCCQTSVALTSAGPLLAYRDRTADEIRDISIARYLNGSWVTSQPIRSDNWHVTYCPVNGPSVAAHDQRAAVAWFTAAYDSPRVYSAFSGDAGATFGSGIRVDDGDPLGRVDVQMLRTGALVSWLERSGDGAAIRVRYVRPNGHMSRSATVSNTSPERGSGFPQMLVSGERVVFAWIEPGTQRLRMATAGLN